MDLIDKPNDDDDLPYPKLWERDPISEARWRKHRDQMIRQSHPGHRPTEWWIYERNSSRPFEREAHALYEMGELTESELKSLMPYWREKFDRSWESGFCYRAGDNNWLEDAAARKAWYRLFDIPDAIIRKWNEERRRSIPIVRKLKRGERT